MEDQDPKPTPADLPEPVSQVDQSKFMVYLTLALFGFIVFMSIMIQFATRGR
jgi:hypothetical protein